VTALYIVKYAVLLKNEKNLYNITDKVKEMNKGQLPEDWWKK